MVFFAATQSAQGETVRGGHGEWNVARSARMAKLEMALMGSDCFGPSDLYYTLPRGLEYVSIVG